MKPIILLLGSSGQIGSELSACLPAIGEVVAPVRDELDLLDLDKTRHFVRSLRPQIILNAAAYTAVDAAESARDFAQVLNVRVPELLAEEAANCRATLVHYSTDYVFDGWKRTPYDESDATNPLNVYGKTKLGGEEAIRQSGVSHLIFRTSWVYATHGKNFLRTILRLATQREELTVVSDQTGAPTRAKEIAEATTNILKANLSSKYTATRFASVSGTYHMTAAGSTTWFDFASVIMEQAANFSDLPWLADALEGRKIIAKRLVPVSFRSYGSPTPRPAFSLLSNRRLLETFGTQLPDWRVQLQQCFSQQSQVHSSFATP